MIILLSTLCGVTITVQVAVSSQACRKSWVRFVVMIPESWARFVVTDPRKSGSVGCFALLERRVRLVASTVANTGLTRT